jgi:hypothetical protein
MNGEITYNIKQAKSLVHDLLADLKAPLLEVFPVGSLVRINELLPEVKRHIEGTAGCYAIVLENSESGKTGNSYALFVLKRDDEGIVHGFHIEWYPTYYLTKVADPDPETLRAVTYASYLENMDSEEETEDDEEGDPDSYEV